MLKQYQYRPLIERQIMSVAGRRELRVVVTKYKGELTKKGRPVRIISLAPVLADDWETARKLSLKVRYDTNLLSRNQTTTEWNIEGIEIDARTSGVTFYIAQPSHVFGDSNGSTLTKKARELLHDHDYSTIIVFVQHDARVSQFIGNYRDSSSSEPVGVIWNRHDQEGDLCRSGNYLPLILDGEPIRFSQEIGNGGCTYQAVGKLWLMGKE